jgi:hypothetical protein
MLQTLLKPGRRESIPTPHPAPLRKAGLLMRRTVLLLATMALALLLVGGVAASKQRQEQSTSSQSPTTTDKSSGDVTIQSTALKASFTKGSGVNFLGVKVSDHGNLLSFESPAGQEAVSGEGYTLCSNSGATVHGYDVGLADVGFGTPTFAQPTAGALPLTVTRNTTDGKFQLKQVWAKPDATEKDVTVTMTLKNLSSSTISDVFLTRSGNFNVGTSSNDRAALTGDSAFLWDDRIGGPDSSATGLQLTALTLATLHGPDIASSANWAGGFGGDPRYQSNRCDDFTELTPVGSGNWAMRLVYKLGNMSAGQSKTVKYEYGRM